jgi:hypothetical protein
LRSRAAQITCNQWQFKRAGDIENIDILTRNQLEKALEGFVHDSRVPVCFGEHPMTRLNAVLNALSDSYPSDSAIDAIDAPATSRQTREVLGWEPKHPGLIADLDRPRYFAG